MMTSEGKSLPTVNETLDVYEAEENSNVTLKWIRPDPNATPPDRLYVDLMSMEPLRRIYRFDSRDETYTDDEFKGRLHCDPQLVRNGGIRCLLAEVRLSDAGRYRCYVVIDGRRDHRDWELVVRASIPQTQEETQELVDRGSEQGIELERPQNSTGFIQAGYRMKMMSSILLLLILSSCLCAATFVVNVTQSSYQAEEKQSITLEWTFTTKTQGTWKNLFIYCEAITDHGVLVLYQVHEGVEIPESQDDQFSGRVQSDKDVLREGRIRLHVSRLRTEDSGLYLCDVKNWRWIQLWKMSTQRYCSC
ncbi:uncharacterized protein LOC129376447 [Poeciliopsis prolifica]|uniref:uncharacterized protein LOC129376447 n=1 Tax=Poeciliopsis prolifica TaxID=188132 RepID=UPI00241428AD|nr:uncharacterized protein LOC129376447 [Poeciliopsis prolifica]